MPYHLSSVQGVVADMLGNDGERHPHSQSVSTRDYGGKVWITSDVNLPVELLDAHAAGQLVLFVGAGASMGVPSGLPSFSDLARQLADAARVPFNEDMELDRFLGSMPADFETHVHAQRLIARPDSRFNSTHLALVRLASALGTPRVVTTNFDNHLLTASTSALLPESDLWVGPALPLGDEFSGIVHLHGSVLRPPAQLVLTDRDFGHAYLTDAWATRFLQRMFDEFTVLFVGYSHDDPIMRYLALGLPSNTRRFVLTHLPDDNKWTHLGVTPVPYPAIGSDHSGLTTALEAWDHRARMGRLDHQARMKEILDTRPPLNPVDEDYLRHQLQSADGARAFAQFASGVDWLQWLEEVKDFTGLFTGAPDSEVSSVLSQWFADNYVADPALHGAALQVVQRQGHRFSPTLYRSVSWAVETLTKADVRAGRRWTVLLATSIDGISAPPDLDMLLPYDPGDQAEDLALVRVALRPFLSLKRPWIFGQEELTSPPWAEAAWHASEDVLTRHVQRLIEDYSPGDPALGTLLEDALGNAYELLSAYSGREGHDSLGFHRSAIERHPQDGLRYPVDALIDGLRDYGEKALSVLPELAGRWWARGMTLFQRLALHLVAANPEVEADDKIQWTLDRNIVFESRLKHEVFSLLATALPEAGADKRSLLLAAVLAGPTLPHDTPDVERHRAYGIYNILVWLTRSDPSWSDARQELDRVHKENPTFNPREFPDLNSWSTTETSAWDEMLPMEVEDLLRDLQTDPEAALTALLAVDYSEQRMDGPTWHGALNLVRRAAAGHPDLGLRLWAVVKNRSTLGTKRNDLQSAILAGWVRADLSEHLTEIISEVNERAGVAELTRAITQLLVGQIESNLDELESEPIAAMRDLARAVWGRQRGTFAPDPGSKPSFLALNSWPGDLARYWALEVNRRWRELGQAWVGLNDDERQVFEALLAEGNGELQAIRPALGARAHFLFTADPAFAQEHILPLFDGDHASDAWEAYLYNARWDNRMLGSGFLQSLIAQWGRLDRLGEGLRVEFYVLVASIVSFANITDEQRQELLSQSVLAHDGDYAADFVSTILRFFKNETTDGGALWELWARDHLNARLQGLPRTMRPGELERWADIAPFAGEYTDEAFSMLSGRGIGLGDGYHVPDWPAELLASKGTALVDFLAERIRNSSTSDRISSYSVRRLVTELTESFGDVVAAPLVAAAVDAGFVPPQAPRT